MEKSATINMARRVIFRVLGKLREEKIVPSNSGSRVKFTQGRESNYYFLYLPPWGFVILDGRKTNGKDLYS